MTIPCRSPSGDDSEYWKDSVSSVRPRLPFGCVYTSLLIMAPLVWFVTGCSSGLGELFVKEVLARGDHVFATAPNGVSRIQQLADVGADTLELDVTASQEEITAKVEEAAAKYGRIDVLINNAGFMASGVTEESS